MTTNPKGTIPVNVLYIIDQNGRYQPGTVKGVQRGGSFLCSDQYCIRYRPGSRGKGEVSSGSNNLGFRCVRNTEGLASK